MIEIKGAEMMAVIPETGMIVPMGMIKDATVTLPEPKDLGGTERNIRRLTHSFETTISNARISGYTIRAIANINYNNELRRHHKPMKKHRAGEYKPITGKWHRRHWLWPALKEKRHGRKARRRGK